MKISKTSLFDHMLGLACIIAGGIISIISKEYTVFAISLGACALLFIVGIESDLYGNEAQT